MCGIAGCYRFSAPALDQDRWVVQGMLRSQQHRGPSAGRVFEGPAVTLGHRRLAILDLSEAATQPMTNETGDVVVTFNGEVYNYRDLRCTLQRAGHAFVSATDSEVLVHGYEEWGIDGLLERLCGMYAFAIYDARKTPLLFLVRDRVGIKPLYYAAPGGAAALYFASEVRAIANNAPIGNEPDEDALFGFLALGSIPWPHTVLKEVSCLAPGHYLAASERGIRVERYWEFRPDESGGTAGEEFLHGLLKKALGEHLLSDVPLGIFLSGGVDSAGLVALASRLQAASLDTLTIRFEETQYDESEPAARVARTFGTRHREIRVTGREFLREVPRVLAAMDQPAHDGVNTWFVSRAAAQAGLTVVLSGLGGDEVFWGYSHYRRLSEESGAVGRFLRAPLPVRRLLTLAGSAYGSLAGKEALRRLNYLRNRLSPGAVYLALRGFFPPAQIQRLLGIGSRELQRKTDWLLHLLEDGPSSTGDCAGGAEDFSRLEMQRYLHDQLLRDTDVFSMAHSIEARVPYLDHRVVELAGCFGAQRKLSVGVNKPLLLRALRDPLVEELAAVPKRGFTFPFQMWIREAADELGAMAELGRWLDGDAVRGLWKQLRRGNLHWSRAWATVALAGASGRVQ